MSDVSLPRGLVIDALVLEAPALTVDLSGPRPLVSAEETSFEATISEPNLNALIRANLPTDHALSEVRLSVLSGKLRLEARVKIFNVSLLCQLRVENGIRILLEVGQSTAGGMGVPQAVTNIVLENRIPRSFDLSGLPVPVYITDLRLEPGRIVVHGQVRLTLPPPGSEAGLALSPTPDALNDGGATRS